MAGSVRRVLWSLVIFFLATFFLRSGQSARIPMNGHEREDSVMPITDSSDDLCQVQTWPDASVPYHINQAFSYLDKYLIKNVIKGFNKLTCVKFIPVSDKQKNYVEFVKDQYCSAAIGMIGHRQEIKLGNCTDRGSILHEMMHTIGFFREENRLDRDKFVTIHWENIMEGKEGNFGKYNCQFLNHKYDYGSIMHSGRYYFSKNDKATITPKKDGVTIGQRDEISATDQLKMKDLYKC